MDENDDEYFSGTCPTCGQPYCGGEIARLQRVVAAASLYINATDRELAELSRSREGVLREFHELQGAMVR